MIRRPPRSTQSRSSAASDVYKRQQAGGRPAGERTRQVQTGRRDPAKTLRAVGATRHGQHSGERREDMIEEAIGQLTPIVGTTKALASVGADRATWYRQHRQS